MADAAEFTLKLNDQFSGPAKNASRSVNDLDRAFGKLEHGAAKGSFLGTLFGNIASQALVAAAAILRMGASAALSFGRAIAEAGELRERFVKAFNIQMGGVGGLAEFERIRRIAIDLGAPLEQTEAFFLQMRALKFPADQTEELFLRMQDLKVGARLTTEQLDRTLLAIRQIKSTGKLQGDELNQLAEAGVNTEEVMKNIAKAMGVSVDEARKLKEAGKIDAGTAIRAIQDAMATMAGGKAPGQVAKDFANNSLSGIIEKLKNFVPVIFDTIAKAAGPGLAKLQPIFKEIFDFISGEEGTAIFEGIGEAIGMIGSAAEVAWPFLKEFVAGFSEGFGEAIGPLKEAAKAFIEAFGGDGGNTMKQLLPIARAMGKAFGALAVILGFLAMVTAAVVGALGALLTLSFAVLGGMVTLAVTVAQKLGEMVGKVIAFGTSMLTAGTTAAKNLIDGLVNGITSGAQRAVDAVSSLGNSVISAFKASTDSHSPSRAFADLGDNLGAGLEVGMGAREGSVRTASSSMGQAATTGAAEPIATATSSGGMAAGAGGASINFSPVIQLTLPAGSDAQRVGEEVEAGCRRAFLGVMEQMAPAGA